MAFAVSCLAQTISDPDLAAADRLWIEFNMPTLSRDSCPGLTFLGGWMNSKPVEGIGFTNPAGFPSKSYVIGSTVLPLTEDFKPATWDLVTLKTLNPDQAFFFYGQFIEDTALCAAIESDLAGQRPFAEALLAKRAEESPAYFHDPNSYFGVTVDNSLAAYTAIEIEADLANELIQPDSDRADILRRLKSLDAKSLIKTTKYCGPKKLIESLEATLNTPHAAPGTPEGAIDDLCEATGIELEGQSHEIDPKVALILRMGNAALPALYRHLQDIRLTRSLWKGMMSAPAQVITIGEAANDLIHRITGKPYGGSSIGSK
jgi:hypothetical protein